MAKNIVVCLDGTWNNSSGWMRGTHKKRFTNVYKLYFLACLATHESLRQNSPKQVCLYVSGVGTFGFLDKLPMGVSGKGVLPRILTGYQFIAGNYAEGDRIYIFGFSRGAYAARHLAGLIVRFGLDKCNLLRTHHLIVHQYREEVWQEYRSRSSTSQHRIPSVHFLGLWDTIGTTGFYLDWRKNRAFVGGRLESGIRVVRHAIAMDDCRRSYKPHIYEASESSQDVQQFWFSGSHSDVGGGNKESGLSDVTLQWMLDEAKAYDLLLAHPTDLLPEFAPNIKGRIQLAWKGLHWPGFSRTDCAAEPPAAIHIRQDILEERRRQNLWHPSIEN